MITVVQRRKAPDEIKDCKRSPYTFRHTRMVCRTTKSDSRLTRPLEDLLVGVQLLAADVLDELLLDSGL
jgi:hypothetical protein